MAQLQQVIDTSATDSSSSKSVTATCPSGKKAISGGASVVNASVADDIAIRTDQPSGDTTGWTATAVEINAVAGSWAVRAFAICAVVAQ